MTNETMGFGISSQQCHLLLMLEGARTLSEIAQVSGKDPSVISRELKNISHLAPVVDKHGPHWYLTPLGKELNRWTRAALLAQNEILKRPIHLRAAAPVEFLSLILRPQLSSFLGSNVKLTLVPAPEGIESLLRDGRCDFGFETGRPFDPAISFEHVIDLKRVVVAAPTYLGRNDTKSTRDLARLPHLAYRRPSDPELGSHWNVTRTFHDAGAAREACLEGLGWCLLPEYAVKAELSSGALVEVEGWKVNPQPFGVWWSESLSKECPWARKAIAWLATRAEKLK